MESYVEITFIQSVATILLSVQIAQYMTLRALYICKTITYAVLLSLSCVLLWGVFSFVFVALLEAVFFFTFFRNVKKTWMFAFMYRWMLMLTCFLIWKGSFHNLIWFVPLHCPILFIWLVYIFCFFLLYAKWDIWLAKQSCIYAVSLLTKDGWKNMKGYLDSGNLLEENGIPVLFVNDRWRSFFSFEDIHYIQMKGISYSGNIAVYKTLVMVTGCRKHEVYICFQQDMQLPMHAQILLNMNLMTMG